MHFIAITRRLTERFSDAQFAEHLAAEGERARALYAAGSFRALYSRGDKPGAVIEIEAADVAEAEALVASLPFALHGLMEYEIVPLRPYRVFAGA
jgi:muconolactone delta-isomerase